MAKFFTSIAGMALATGIAGSACAQEDVPTQTLFTNVHVFDGVNEARMENANVLVEGNLIKEVSTEAIDAPDATVIDGGGRTLMPGMHDQHVHLTVFNPLSDGLRQNITPFHLGGVATIRSERILMNGLRRFAIWADRQSPSRGSSIPACSPARGSILPRLSSRRHRAMPISVS